MTVHDVLSYLIEQQIEIRSELATIYVSPREKVTAALAEAITKHKPELLFLLSRRLEPDAGRPPYEIWLRGRDWDQWQLTSWRYNLETEDAA